MEKKSTPGLNKEGRDKYLFRNEEAEILAMAKNRLNKELDFIESVLKQWRTVPEKQRINYLEKSLSVCVCVLLLFLVLRVGLGV